MLAGTIFAVSLKGWSWEEAGTEIVLLGRSGDSGGKTT